MMAPLEITPEQLDDPRTIPVGAITLGLEQSGCPLVHAAAIEALLLADMIQVSHYETALNGPLFEITVPGAFLTFAAGPRAASLVDWAVTNPETLTRAAF